MSLKDFNAKWTLPDYPPLPVAEEEFYKTTQAFGVSLPAEYREAVLKVGLPRPALALLDAIVDQQLHCFDLSQLFAPHEIVQWTLDWHEIGLPKHLIGIANDCCGNFFCFDLVRFRVNFRLTENVFIQLFASIG